MKTKKLLSMALVLIFTLANLFSATAFQLSAATDATTFDGGFENNGWYYENTAKMARSSDEKYAGEYSGVVNNTNHSFMDTPINTWKPESGKYYYLSFWAKASDDYAGEVRAKVQLRGSNGITADLWISGSGITAENEWVEYRYDVTSVFNAITDNTSAIRIDIYPRSHTSGNLYVDEFKFVKGMCIDGKQDPDAEAVTTLDGGFENNKWSYESGATMARSSDEKYAGNYSGVVNNNNYSFMTTPIAAWEPESGKNYYLSFWAKASDDYDGVLKARVQLRGGGGDIVDLWISGGGITAENKWVEYRYDVTSVFNTKEETTDGIRIYLYPSSHKSGNLYLDEFKFVEGQCINGKQDVNGKPLTTVDGGFENGKWFGIAGSSFITPTRSTEEKYAGAYSGEINGAYKLWADTELAKWAPESNKNYYISFMAKATADYAGKTAIKLELRGSHASIYGADLWVANDELAAESEWTEYRYNITSIFNAIKDETSVIRLNILSYTYTSGKLYLDEIKFVEGTCTDGKQNQNPIIVENSAENSFGNMCTVSTDDKDYVVSESFVFTNNMQSAQEAQLTVSVKDSSGNTIQQEKRELSLDVAESVTLSFDFPSISYYGLFSVHFTVENAAGSHDLGDFPVSRIRTADSCTDKLFGVSIHGGHINTDFNDEVFSQIKASGSGWLRSDYPWSYVETAKGVYENCESGIARSAAENGMDTLLILGKANSLYDDGKFPTSDEAIAAFAKYCGAVAKANKGIVKAYEIWNEYNNESDGLDMTKKGANYAKLLKAAYTAIKAEDPNALVVGGAAAGFAESYIKVILENDGHDYMDAVSFHPYCDEKSPEAGELIAKSQAIKNLTASYGSVLPVWATEINWTTSNTSTGVSEKTQAQYLLRTLLLNKENSVFDKIFIYDYANDGNNLMNNHLNYGLVYSMDSAVPYAPKESFAALSGISSVLDGFSYKSTVAAPSNTVKLLELENSAAGKRIYAFWNFGNTVDLSFEFANSGAELIDMYGNSADVSTNTVHTAASGSVKLLLTDSGNTLNSVSVSAPAAPTIALKKGTTVELVAVEGMEYSIDEISWQSSNVFVFDDSALGATVTFYQRYIRIDTSEETAISAETSTKIVPIGDANNDMEVNASDIAVSRKALLGADTGAAFDVLAADANSDGAFNILDLIKIKKIIAAK